jgi:hypothetical protein
VSERSEEVTCECGEMEYCAECMPAIQRVTRKQHTEHHFEVRVPGFDTTDEFRDEGDAQELAVHIQRTDGRQVQIFKRTVEVTELVGEWVQVPAITPAEADAEMQSEVSR